MRRLLIVVVSGLLVALAGCKGVSVNARRGVDVKVFAGSENFSTASLRYNRELGIRTANRPVVSAISATIATDYADATPYSPR